MPHLPLLLFEAGPLADLGAPPHLPYFWHFPLLVVIISLVYSATRFDHWGAIIREALRWMVRLSAFLCAIMIVLYVLANIN
jgi:hypothetical protein